MQGAPHCRISDLSEAARFTMHLKFARECGVVPGNVLPFAGAFKTGGIWIDPAKAETATYLESGPPIQEWRRLVVLGLEELVRRGIARKPVGGPNNPRGNPGPRKRKGAR